MCTVPHHRLEVELKMIPKLDPQPYLSVDTIYSMGLNEVVCLTHTGWYHLVDHNQMDNFKVQFNLS